jgi:hypothetical protein
MLASTRLSAWLSLAVLLAAVAAAPVQSEEKRWFEGSDKVFIRQHNQFVRIVEPDVHLSRARRSFVKDHMALAADELEKAAAGFAYFAERSAGDSRRELAVGERALQKLADDVRARRVSEVTTLDRAIDDAKRILAGAPSPATPGAAPASAPAKTPDAR